MVVVLINPNSTQEMTDSALAAAQRAAPEVAFAGWTSAEGPTAIEGPEDGDRAIPPLLRLVAKASDEGAEAIIIACFDDTGLEEARAMAACPVVGIGNSSFVLGCLMSDHVAVVTTVEAAVPVIAGNIARRGMSDRISQVVAAGTPVLMLEHSPEIAAGHFLKAARALRPETGLLILGCAGAVTIVDMLRQELPYRVIDGVEAAALLCRAIAGTKA